MTMKWSNFSIALGKTGGKSKKCQVATTLKGLNLLRIDLLPTDIMDKKKVIKMQFVTSFNGILNVKCNRLSRCGKWAMTEERSLQRRKNILLKE